MATTNRWNKLDNAAKIFPSADSKAETQVYRLSCELVSPIDEKLLSKALRETIQIFDVYQYVMKHGLFWYYLEHSDIEPVVRQEYKPPCAPLYNTNETGLLYEVTYYQNRINLEVYHVLSDGTGAMRFMQTLIIKYLTLVCGIEEPPLPFDASQAQMENDSFQKYYDDEQKKQKQRFKKAYSLSGFTYPENRLGIITGRANVKQALAAAHACNTTLTGFLCACLIDAIGSELSTRAKKRPVILSVPVNLRKYFPSESARNFFGLVYVEYDFSKEDGSFQSIVEKVRADLKNNLSAEKLANSINNYSAVENNFFARIAPLAMKDFCLGIAYQASMKRSTAAVSNVGVVEMPLSLREQICAFDLYSATNRMQACICSYQDTLSISFTAPYISTDIQRAFFRHLTARGVEVEILANQPDKAVDASERPRKKKQKVKKPKEAAEK